MNKNNVVVNVDSGEFIESILDDFIIDNGSMFSQLTVRKSSLDPNFYLDVFDFMTKSKIQSMIKKLIVQQLIYTQPTTVPYLSN